MCLFENNTHFACKPVPIFNAGNAFIRKSITSHFGYKSMEINSYVCTYMFPIHYTIR